MEKLIRILLVEDDLAWQQGISDLLGSDTRFELAGIADNYQDALHIYRDTQPDAALLDWQIRGDRDGMAVGQALLQAGLPSERIIVISGADPSAIPRHPFLYVPKSRVPEELLSLLITVTIN